MRRRHRPRSPRSVRAVTRCTRAARFGHPHVRRTTSSVRRTFVATTLHDSLSLRRRRRDRRAGDAQSRGGTEHREGSQLERAPDDSIRMHRTALRTRTRRCSRTESDRSRAAACSDVRRIEHSARIGHADFVENSCTVSICRSSHSWRRSMKRGRTRATANVPTQRLLFRRGGARPGAGRKPRGERALVAHARRDAPTRHTPSKARTRTPRCGVPSVKSTGSRAPSRGPDVAARRRDQRTRSVASPRAPRCPTAASSSTPQRAEHHATRAPSCDARTEFEAADTFDSRVTQCSRRPRRAHRSRRETRTRNGRRLRGDTREPCVRRTKRRRPPQLPPVLRRGAIAGSAVFGATSATSPPNFLFLPAYARIASSNCGRRNSGQHSRATCSSL